MLPWVLFWIGWRDAMDRRVIEILQIKFEKVNKMYRNYLAAKTDLMIMCTENVLRN